MGESSRGPFITLDAISVAACQRQLIKDESLSAHDVHERVHAGWTHEEIPWWAEAAAGRGDRNTRENSGL